MKYGEVSADEIFARGKTSFDVADIVTDIIYNVRKRGDEALYEYCEKFDKAKLSNLKVTKEEIEQNDKISDARKQIAERQRK